MLIHVDLTLLFLITFGIFIINTCANVTAFYILRKIHRSD